MVVALEMSFDQRQVGEDASGFVATQAELVGGFGDDPGEPLGASELAVDGGGERSDTRAMNPVGARAADPGECSFDPGQRLGCFRGLEVCACGRGPEARQWASVRPDVADRLRGGAQVSEGLQWLAPLPVVLGSRHLDQRGELAVGLRMGLYNPFQPRRSVVVVAQGDQADEQFQHPRRVGPDRRLAVLVQPQPDGGAG